MSEASLNLSALSLTSLPGLQAWLQHLHVSNNDLTGLPSLPPALRYLDASFNQLTHLPPLPAGLSYLDVRFNQLINLPALGRSLLYLNADGNMLSSLPENLLEINRMCLVGLEQNPLSERVRTNLERAVYAEGYQGPQIFFSMNEGVEQATERPLDAVVADWLEGDPQAVALWETFANEENAADYARFLDKLRDTVNYGNETFRQSVREGIRQAETSPSLRRQYFQLAFDATRSCQDRVTLAWNGMQTARLNAEIENGVLDGELNKILQRVRVQFRLDALHRIAREKVRSLRLVDEIEVYLAYQVKLRDALEFEHIAPDMRYFGVSYVTETDLADAAASVREQEARDFENYLVTLWDPWQRVLERLVPEEYAAMKARLADEEEFSRRLDLRLAEYGLAGDDDATRELGNQVFKEIKRDLCGELTRRVLERHGLALSG
ncbi:NEL-type E3 ubiquitin ligase domain-containing protein [Bradyrhizobium sp. USDA 4501]